MDNCNFVQGKIRLVAHSEKKKTLAKKKKKFNLVSRI